MSRLRIAIANSDSELIAQEILKKKNVARSNCLEMVKIPEDLEEFGGSKSFSMFDSFFFYESFLMADKSVKSFDEKELNVSIPVPLLPHWIEEKEAPSAPKPDSPESTLPEVASGDVGNQEK